MRIHFSNVNFSSSSGPNSFGSRLAHELVRMGHDVVKADEQHDVFLAFIEAASQPHPGAKTVLRLDGIWFRPDQFETHNRGIRDCYFAFDHVVMQSEFDKRMVEHHFGERADSTVIRNGILVHPKAHRALASDHLNFVCAASWHPQKRLVENIRLFQHIRKQLKEQGKKATLYVLGKNAHTGIDQLDFKTEMQDVVVWGQIDHSRCLALYSICDYMIHLGWLDHCPNVVVEALSVGCPVICTDSGGTPELVREHGGIVIPETTQYNYELLDYDKPYKLDWKDFTLPSEPGRVDANGLHIRKVAERYLEVFNGQGQG